MSRVRADRYTDRAGTGSPTFSEGVNVVGISSLGITTVTGVGQTALTVNGDARITGVLTVGQGSVTINGDSSLNTISGVTTVYTTSINDLSYPSAGPLSNRNLIINGAMQVAQRGTSISMVTTALFCTDRFKAVSGSSFNWQSTLTQENDGPSGFSKSLKVNVDTASTPTGSHNAVFYYRLEGQDCQSLGYGTNDAKTTTLSFWVKSNKTGTYSVQLANNNPTKYLLVEYSINSADTWEYKTMSFVGDTASTVDNDNGEGLDVRWNLAAGSTDLAAPTNTWVSTAGIRASNDQVNLMDTVNNYWQITGVQLELGTRATPFEHRSYGEELALCERYCQSFNGRIAIGNWNGGTGALVTRYLSPPMRTTPTIHSYTAGNCLVEAVNWYSVGSVTIQGESTNSSVTFQLSSITNSGQSFNANATWGNAAAAIIQAEL